MRREFTMSSQHKYFAEIEYHCEGKEMLLEEELWLMKKHWPSMEWEIGIDILTLSGKTYEITEDATMQFLNAVKRHEWWDKK